MMYKILNKRKIKYGSNSIILTISVIGIIILINLFTFNNSYRIDMTKNKLYSLSEQTIKVISSLDNEVEIIGFFHRDSQLLPEIAELLKEYKHKSNKIKYSLVDLDSNPVRANKYGVTDYDTIVLTSGDKTIQLRRNTFYKTDYRNNTIVFAGEEAITQGIIDVTSERNSKVYFIEGHGEVSGDDVYVFKDSLNKEGYTVEALNIAQKGGIPEDAELLVIISPLKDYNDEELYHLDKYVQRGGRFLFLMDPMKDISNLRRLTMFMSTLGIKLNNDLVVDPERNYFRQLTSIIPRYSLHKIVDQLGQKGLALILPYTMSIDKSESLDKGGSFEELLLTSDKAWGESNIDGKEIKLDEKDKKGPLTVAAVVTKPLQKGETKAVVIGNSSIIKNEIISLQGNLDFLINSINYLLGKENLISIRPKESGIESILINGNQGTYLLIIFTFIIPILIFIMGIIVFLRRKNR